MVREMGALDELAGSGWDPSNPDAIWRYVGLVSQENVEKAEAVPNIARGKGC
jgi:hypothetical protein